MTAQDYPVTFPYGATKYPYSVSNPHKGNDRKMPKRTPIVIGNTTIGYSGNTGSYNGMTYDYHLHTQAWTGSTVDTVNPAPYEFKPGKVMNTGTGATWGKFVTVKVDGVNISYCHLDEIVATAGQVIEGGQMSTVGDIELDMLSKAFFGYGANAEFINAWKGTETNTMIRWCDANPAHTAWLKQIEAWKNDNFVPVTEQLFKKG